MKILKDLPELVDASVIDPETAEKIRQFYRDKQASAPNRLFLVFGLLGSMLVGLGIILIVAHNWDQLSRPLKTILAFIPLIIGQAIGAFTLLKRFESTAWRESSAVFITFAMGACIALVSQIYHIEGELSGFLFTWCLLSLPIIYVLRSSATSLLYIIGITFYAFEVGYWSRYPPAPYWYLLLLMAVLPHYYQLFRKSPRGNFIAFHHWLVPLSLLTTLGAFATELSSLMYVAYMSLFGLFMALGQHVFFDGQKLRNNGYKVLGQLGTAVLLLVLSFDDIWRPIQRNMSEFQLTEILLSSEMLIVLLLTGTAIALVYLRTRSQGMKSIRLFSVIFLLFILIYTIGSLSGAGPVVINVLTLSVGVLAILEGSKNNSLGQLNFGLLIVTALIICRFFDMDLTFVVRGIIFVLLGGGFFAANYWLLKKRKAYE